MRLRASQVVVAGEAAGEVPQVRVRVRVVMQFLQ
jgi:hypothetical protein